MIKPRFWGAVVFAALIVGCARPATPAGTLQIAQQWQPRSLNPALENGTSSTEFSMLIFSYLVKYDDRGRLIPDVATEVPTLRNGGISADGKTIVYHIRRGIRFGDGTPLTAADCAWSINAINNPRNNVQSRFAYDDVARADAPNETTLVLHLKRPFPPVIVVVEAPQGFPILPKHVLENSPDFNDVPFDSAPFGSGPYIVTHWSRGDRVELRRNPFYWKGKPGISTIVIRFVENSQTAINLLKTREVDGYFDDQNFADFPLLKAVPGYIVTSTQQNAVGAIIFNTQDPLTSDPRVRHALAEAIDIPQLIQKTYRGALESRHAGAGLFLWAFDPAAYPDIPYDPKDARSLLDRAGWHMGSDGIRHKAGRALDVLLILQAATPGDATFADNVVEYERAVGVHVTLKQFDISQFVAPAGEGGPVYGGKFQMALYSFENGDDPDTTDQFACTNVPPNGYNKSRVCDPRIDSLLKAGLATYDPAKRTAVYRSLQSALYRELPIALIYRRTQVNAFSERLRGQTTSLSGAFWNVAAWRLTNANDPPNTCAPKLFRAAGTFERTTSALHGPGLVLSGGGTSIDGTFRWMHQVLTGSQRARGGNVIVLRAHTDEDEYSAYIEPLGPFQSVRMIGIPSCASRASVDALARYIDEADAVYFAGGDQANYVPWKGSALIAAVRRLWARGGVVGGTSAGLAVQGSVIFDSAAADRLHPNDDFSVRTQNAARNPFEPEISFTTGFLAWPPLQGIITDTHFARRDRFGRLVAFMARARHEHLTNGPIYGLGVDERSALVVDRNGIATLMEYRGSGYQTRGAYVLSGLKTLELRPDHPLRASAEVLHVDRPGAWLNLYSKLGTGFRYRVTVDGAKRSPYDRNPYGRR